MKQTAMAVAMVGLAACAVRVDDDRASSGSVRAGDEALDACAVVGASFACASCGVAGANVDVSALDFAAVPALPVTSTDGPRKLLFSDSPETPTRSGILFQADVDAGPARIYVYNVNGTSIAKKISVVVDNEDDAPLTMSIERYAVGAPSTSYATEGQDVAAAFLVADNAATKSVAPHARGLLLVQHLDGVVVGPNELQHAIVDVTFDRRVRVRVVMLDATTDTLAHVDDVAVLPRDGHTRGTFGVADRTLSSSCAFDGVVRVPLGAAVLDGVDELTGDAAHLDGEYGVVTTIDLATPKRLVEVPRGGFYAGVTLVDGAAIETSGGSVARGVSVGVGSHVAWTGPGGSSLPLALLLLPAS